MNRSLAIDRVRDDDRPARRLSSRERLIVPWKAPESTETRKAAVLDAHDPQAAFTSWPGSRVIALTVWAWRTPPIADQPDWDALGVSHSEGMVYRTDGARRLTLDVYRPSETPMRPAPSACDPRCSPSTVEAGTAAR